MGKYDTIKVIYRDEFDRNAIIYFDIKDKLDKDLTLRENIVDILNDYLGDEGFWTDERTLIPQYRICKVVLCNIEEEKRDKVKKEAETMEEIVEQRKNEQTLMEVFKEEDNKDKKEVVAEKPIESIMVTKENPPSNIKKHNRHFRRHKPNN